eukprot:2213557-Rhodomonas_salina.1
MEDGTDIASPERRKIGEMVLEVLAIAKREDRKTGETGPQSCRCTSSCAGTWSCETSRQYRTWHSGSTSPCESNRQVIPGHGRARAQRDTNQIAKSLLDMA